MVLPHHEIKVDLDIAPSLGCILTLIDSDQPVKGYVESIKRAHI